MVQLATHGAKKEAEGHGEVHFLQARGAQTGAQTLPGVGRDVSEVLEVEGGGMVLLQAPDHGLLSSCSGSGHLSYQEKDTIL